ncbi:MAG TPA: phage holin family protein [Propylenella sp.]
MLKLASAVGLGLAAANLRRRIRGLAVRGMLGVVGIIILVIAVCFFLLAAHLYLSVLLDPIASAAIIAGILLAIALVLLFLASRPMRERARGVEQPAAEIRRAVNEGLAGLGLGAEGSPLRSPVLLSSLFALLAGILLGSRASRRKRDD